MRPRASGACQHDTRIGVEQVFADFLPRDPEARTVPVNLQLRRVIGEPCRLLHVSRHTGNLGHAFGNVIQPALPLRPFRLVVALGPRLDRGQHAHDLFFANLERSSEGVMRRAV